MKICIDASCVGMLIAPDEASEQVLKAFEAERQKGSVFVAPTLLSFETASILRKKELRKLLTPQESIGAWRFFKALKITLHHDEEILERALSLSQSFGPKMTVYDASYIALAERLEAKFWTADRVLYEIIRDIYPHFVLFTA